MSAVASLKRQAPQTFPANTRSISASSKACSGVVPISPAACTMPASGGSSACTVAKRRATSRGLATSAAMTRTSQPHCSRSASMRCCAASLGERRLVSTRCRAPCAARYPAISSPDRTQPAGHQICCVITQFQRCGDRLPGASSQPGNIDRLVPQRDLVFAARCCQQLVYQPGPFVGTTFRQICQSAPQSWMFQRGGATESP